MECKICNSNNIRLLDSRLRLYKCKNCTHEFSFPLIDEEYKEDYFKQEHKNWFDNPNYELFDLIFKNTMSNGSLIDVGSGTGDFLKYLKEKKAYEGDLYGTDIIDIKLPYDIRYIKGDFISLKMHKKYDNIVSLAVIEHIKEPQLFIKKISEISNNKAKVIIMTFNSDGLIYRLANVLKKFGFRTAFDRLYSPHHVNHFNNKSLKKLLQDNDFKVVKHLTTNYPMKSVDVPNNSFVYKIAVFFIFKLSDINQSGIMQTIICEKN